MSHNCTPAKMRLYIDVVTGHQIDDVLICLTFAAGISHTAIIVNFADDVNASRRDCEAHVQS